MTEQRIKAARDKAVAAFDALPPDQRSGAVENIANRFYDEIVGLADDAADAEERAEALEAELRRKMRTPPPRAVTAGRPGGNARPAPPRADVRDKDLTSPFRFVALNDKVVAGEKTDLDTPLPGGFRAVVSVEWAVETPLLIGATNKTDRTDAVIEPMKLGDDYVIPGATLRGAMRAAMEIVASGRLHQINAHHKYGVRDFNHPRIRPPGKDGEKDSILARDKVKAGWLRRIGPKEAPVYEITPCKDWKTVAVADLMLVIGDAKTDAVIATGLEKAKKKRDFKSSDWETVAKPFHFRSSWLGTELRERYRALGGTVTSKKEVDFAKAQEVDFIPNTAEKAVGELVPLPRNARDSRALTGRFVVANRSPAAASPAEIKKKEAGEEKGQPKKREYVFIDNPHAKPFEIPAEAWDRFELINSKPGRNKRAPDGSWKALKPSLDLPDGMIPVFYINGPKNPEDPVDEEKFEFGLTRFFKVAHEFSVGQVRERDAAHRRPPNNDPGNFPIDFVESLFGYVFEKKDIYDKKYLSKENHSTAPRDVARRGRIAFGFARLSKETPAVLSNEIPTVMGAPRASFAPFYLAGQYKDYSDGGSRLAGRKRYLPRFPAADLNGAAATLEEKLRGVTGNGNADTMTRLRFLRPQRATELAFRGDIRLDNVRAEEIGALLWVLTHGGAPDKRYRHMLGHAKTFGAGQTRVKSLRLRLYPNDDAATELQLSPNADELPAPGREGWLAADSASMKPFLAAFEATMNEKRSDWRTSRDMLDYLAACDPAHGKKIFAEGKDKYPELTDFKKIREPCQLDSRVESKGPPALGRPRYLPV